MGLLCGRCQTCGVFLRGNGGGGEGGEDEGVCRLACMLVCISLCTQVAAQALCRSPLPPLPPGAHLSPTPFAILLPPLLTPHFTPTLPSPLPISFLLAQLSHVLTLMPTLSLHLSPRSRRRRSSCPASSPWTPPRSVGRLGRLGVLGLVGAGLGTSWWPASARQAWNRQNIKHS